MEAAGTKYLDNCWSEESMVERVGGHGGLQKVDEVMMGEKQQQKKMLDEPLWLMN